MADVYSAKSPLELIGNCRSYEFRGLLEGIEKMLVTDVVLNNNIPPNEDGGYTIKGNVVVDIQIGNTFSPYERNLLNKEFDKAKNKINTPK